MFGPLWFNLSWNSLVWVSIAVATRDAGRGHSTGTYNQYVLTPTSIVIWFSITTTMCAKNIPEQDLDSPQSPTSRYDPHILSCCPKYQTLWNLLRHLGKRKCELVGLPALALLR